MDFISKLVSPTKYKYYQSFVNLKLRDSDERLKDSKFRNYLIENYLDKKELVSILADSLTRNIKKSQRLLYDHDEYYVALDMLTNTYYICYKNLLMLDIDFYKDNREHETLILLLEDYVKENPQYRFRLFKTRNGIHAFLISKALDCKSNEALDIMLANNNDFYYTIYSYIRGWSVRLNKKIGENSEKLYEYLKDVGIAEIDPNLEDLVNVHLNLQEKFKDTEPSLMFGE